MKEWKNFAICNKKSYQQSNSADVCLERDDIDVKKLEDFFLHYSFPEADAIMSIATGATGDENINCYNTFEEGIRTVKKADGHNFKQLNVFHKVNCIGLLDKKNKIKVNDAIVAINPILTFQRICELKKFDVELKNYMNYPHDLFENGLIRNQHCMNYFQKS